MGRRSVSLTPGDMVELRQLVDRYADAVDRRDAAALAALFEPDGAVVVQAGGGPEQTGWAGPDLPGLLDSLAGYQRTFHHVGGAVFEPEQAGGDGAAVGRVQCLAHHYQRTESGPVDLVMALRYHDRFRRQPGEGWLIVERRVELEWTELHPAHPLRRS